MKPPRPGLPLAAVIVLLAAALFLFSPPPTENTDLCGIYHRIGPVGFTYNCDSFDWCTYAQYPQLILAPKSRRQTRPGFVLLGTYFGYHTKLVFDLLGVESGLHRAPFFAGYIVLNYLLLLAALLLLYDLLKSWGVRNSIIFGLGVFIVSNDVVKAFFWTAHTQILLLAAPLLGIWLWQKFVLAPRFLPGRLYGFSLLGGLLLLTYGIFLALLPFLAYAIFSRWKMRRDESGADYRKAALVSTFLMLYPVFFWVLFVVGLNGEFYNHAMHGARQLVWVFDTAPQGAGVFLRALWSTTSVHLGSVARVALPFVGFLALFLLLNRSGQGEAEPDSAEIVGPARRACYLYFLIHFLYLWFIGTGYDRLTYVLVPLVLCLLGIEMERLLRRRERAATLVTGSLYGIGLAWVLYHVSKYGPFS